MNAEQRRIINVFSDFFKLAGKDESNYMVPENGTWAEKAAMQLRRVKVAQHVLNEGKKIRKADTKQPRYTPLFWIIPDESALGGFRLSYIACAYDNVYTRLGARPEFFQSADAIFFGKEFLQECELLMQYQAMAEQEEEV